MIYEDARVTGAARLDSSSALVRAESAHLDATLHALVQRLSSVPGLKVTVSYRLGRLRRLIGDLPYMNDLHRSSDPIRSLVVDAGPCSYWLESANGSITCGRAVATIEHGEVREALPFTTWAAELFDDISRQNLANHESMAARRHLVEQDQVD